MYSSARISLSSYYSTLFPSCGFPAPSSSSCSCEGPARRLGNVVERELVHRYESRTVGPIPVRSGHGARALSRTGGQRWLQKT